MGLSWAAETLYNLGPSSTSLNTTPHSFLLLLCCFTHSHFLHVCPSPSRLTLHQLLFDLNNLLLQVMPKLVFVAPACLPSPDPLVPLPAGYSNRWSHRTSNEAHPKLSLLTSSKPLPVSARGTLTALPLLPHLATGQSPSAHVSTMEEFLE